MHQRKGIADTVFIVLLFIVFLLFSTLALYLNTALGEQHKQTLVEEISSIDDQTILQGLLSYSYQGKMLAFWIIQAYTATLPENSQLYQSIVKAGIDDYFLHAERYTHLEIQLENRAVYIQERAYSTTPQPITQQRIYQKKLPKEKTIQDLPYNIQILFASTPITRTT